MKPGDKLVCMVDYSGPKKGSVVTVKKINSLAHSLYQLSFEEWNGWFKEKDFISIIKLRRKKLEQVLK